MLARELVVARNPRLQPGQTRGIDLGVCQVVRQRSLGFLGGNQRLIQQQGDFIQTGIKSARLVHVAVGLLQ